VNNSKHISNNLRLRNDKKDIALMEKRKNEPSRPFREYLAEKVKAYRECRGA
jgi:hypothetical protein